MAETEKTSESSKFRLPAAYDPNEIDERIVRALESIAETLVANRIALISIAESLNLMAKPRLRS